MKIVITSVMSFVQNCVYDRYASSIPRGERYQGLIRPSSVFGTAGAFITYCVCNTNAIYRC